MTAIIIQARMASTRLPGKIMKNLAGKPVLWYVVERCRKSKKTDQVIVATTINPEDDLVEKWCQENEISYYRGSSENVLERYYQTAKKYGADVIVRITSDCSLIDPKIIDVCLEAFERNSFDYLSNVVPPPRTFPLGLEVEVFSFAALKKTYFEAKENYEKEHVTPYLWEDKKGDFRIGPTILAPVDYRRVYRLTMDYPEDFELLEKIYKQFYKSGSLINVPAVLKYLDQHPELVQINAHCAQKPVKLSNKLDAIVVLGAGLIKDGNRWRTANFGEGDNFAVTGDRIRVDAAYYLYEDYKNLNTRFLIIVSGGKGQLESVPDAPALAEVLLKELQELGVPADKIYKEDKSGNTYQQLRALDKLVLKLNLERIIVLSNEYHLPRVKAMIEYGPKLKNLEAMLSADDLFLESAEKILVDHDRNRWEKMIDRAYESPAMKERVKLEAQGVAQIKAGTYKFQ